MVADKLSRIRLNPLVSPDTGRRVSIPDVAQNLLLFLPFGMAGAVALGASHKRTADRSTLAIVTALAALLSVFVEIVQLFTPYRTTSLSDVLANSLGALAGAALAGPLWRRWAPAQSGEWARALTAGPAFPMFALALALVCAGAWEPFDVTLDVGTVASKVRRLQADAWQFAGLSDEIVEIVRYVLFGAAAAQWLRRNHAHASALAAAAAVSTAVSLEASQALVASRMPGVADAIVHGAAALCGVAASRWWRRGGIPRPVAAILAAATVAGGFLQFSAAVPGGAMTSISRGIEVVLIVLQVAFCFAFSRRGNAAE